MILEAFGLVLSTEYRQFVHLRSPDNTLFSSLEVVGSSHNFSFQSMSSLPLDSFCDTGYQLASDQLSVDEK